MQPARCPCPCGLGIPAAFKAQRGSPGDSRGVAAGRRQLRDGGGLRAAVSLIPFARPLLVSFCVPEGAMGYVLRVVTLVGVVVGYY